MNKANRCSLFAGVLFVVTALCASSAFAAVPSSIGIEGRLSSQAGGPVADGTYKVVFSLYATKASAAATWTESVNLAVKGGRFSHTLGSKTALTPANIDATKAAWLGVKVAADPELPRVALSSVAYAVRAAVADQAAVAASLKCTGCVGVGAMKFDGDVNLGGNSLKVKNLTATGDVAATAVTAVSVTAGSFSGDGSKLKGVKVVGGACGAGEVVTGVKPDGSVTCGQGGGAGDLLGGKVSDTFTEVAKTTPMPVNIPDNTGATATAQASYGKVGTANTLAVKVTISNTDLSSVRVKLFPPNDKKTGMTLCDPCGAKDAKSLSKTYTATTALKSGSLKDLLGKSLEGIWTLEVLDSKFCVPQQPGNATLCDIKNKLDGKVSAFEVSATVTSAQSIKLGGTLQLTMLAAAPFPCDEAHKAHMYYDTKVNKLRFCDGNVWRAVSDTCGNGILEAGEECDDGNNTDGDGCSSSCTAVCGDKIVVGKEECDDGNKIDGDNCSNSCVAPYGASPKKAGSSCADIVSVNQKAGVKVTDGAYWIDPDGAGGAAAYPVWCDQTTDGGGWALALKADGSKSTFSYTAAYWTNTSTLAGTTPSAAKSEAKYAAFNSQAFKQVRLVMEAKGVTKSVTLSLTGSSLRSLFGGGAKATSIGRNAWKALVAGGSAQPHCNREGVNRDCGSRKVRLGLLTNQENDCNSCDSYIGVGHTGQAGCDGVGASYCGLMASCSPDNGSKNIPAFVWLWVR